jgi:hypothetical protein
MLLADFKHMMVGPPKVIAVREREGEGNSKSITEDIWWGWKKGHGTMLHHLMTTIPHAENDAHSRNSSQAETWPQIRHGKINGNANETPSALTSNQATQWNHSLMMAVFLPAWVTS